MNIITLRRRLNYQRLAYRMSRIALRYANQLKWPGLQGRYLNDCRAVRNELLNTMLQLRIALAVRAARRAEK